MIYENDLSIYSGEPYYRVGFQSSNINDGKYFVMDIWITGAGDVDFGKLSIKIPPYLVDNESIDVIRHDYYYEFYNMSNQRKVRIKPIIILDKRNKTNLVFQLPLIYFYPFLIDPNQINIANYGEVTMNENQIKLGNYESWPANWTYKLPEYATKDFYLYKLIFKKPNNIPAGDHYITFDLFYKWQNKWYKDSQSLPLHVNYLYEYWEVQIGIIIIAVIGICCQIDGAICRHSWAKNKKDRFLSNIRHIIKFFSP